MRELLTGVNVVFHLASAHLQISLPESEYWDVNVHSLPHLLELAQQRGVERFVHVSSVGLYGNLKNLPADEESECEPQSIYGETKLAGEAEVLRCSKENNFPVVIIRPAWVYGPYCPRTLKIYRTLRKGMFIMIGNGENFRHPLYITDMLDSFRLAMERDEAVGEVFVIAGEEAITTNKLVESFCTIMKLRQPRLRIPYSLGVAMASACEVFWGLAGKEPPISRRSLEFFDTNNAFDITKGKRLLGFLPKFSFQNGLYKTRDWLVNNE
jgi:nucleoside-diphosphate-sugar epimerase